VVEASRIESSVVTVRTRTWNVLYAIKGLVPEPAFGEPREVAVRELWKWTGEPWGGPVPPGSDGTTDAERA
jgi:hypothetical protein